MADVIQRTDEELVEDYLDGEVGAFRLLIERYHDPLLNFLFRLVGNRQAAEDVFQDAFLQVHQSLGSFDLTRTFKPWLFTIAANKGRDALRKSNRRAAVSLSMKPRGSGGGGGGEGDELVDLLQIEVPGPGAGMEAAETSVMVQHAVDAIPTRLREILLLAYFQKLSYTQIADQLGIPVGTVKSRLHAAVAAFAKRWQEQMDLAKRKNRREQAT
jgi:RNA polymerase sigma-70 factor (ECF subfamily)